MTIFQSIILGLVQGLGEFLPISSSGHLALAPWLFGWQDPGLSFDVALHFGTLLAVLIYFYKDFFNIAKAFFTQKESSGYSKKFIWILAVATIPGAISGYLLDDLAEKSFRNPLLIASALAIAGIILYIADKQLGEKAKKVNLKSAIIIGLSQAVAIIPGVSRSGATISAGLFCGLNRKASAKFSFLLSAPIIFGATIMKAGDFFRAGVGAVEILGMFAAFISGLGAIIFLIKLLAKHDYKIFVWYRLILAALIILIWFIR